jgi:hypothetical protein
MSSDYGDSYSTIVMHVQGQFFERTGQALPDFLNSMMLNQKKTDKAVTYLSTAVCWILSALKHLLE